MLQPTKDLRIYLLTRYGVDKCNSLNETGAYVPLRGVGYTLENGIEWLLAGNDLDICYTERQNHGEIEAPICWDLTGTNYVDLVFSEQGLTLGTIIVAFYVLYRCIKYEIYESEEDFINERR